MATAKQKKCLLYNYLPPCPCSNYSLGLEVILLNSACHILPISLYDPAEKSFHNTSSIKISLSLLWAVFCITLMALNTL